jgi:co-chaperonin GroES (HSP10)
MPPRKPSADDERPSPPARVSRHIQPLGPRVLVRVIKSPDRSESGLFLPAGAKDNHSEALLAEVVEVARTMPKPSIVVDIDDDDDEPKADLGENVSGIPVGAQVLFAKDQGITVPWDDSLRLLAVRHVLAIVDIIPEDNLQ